jgi:chromosome segregation ATPase
MSKKRRDEEKREVHIERRREAPPINRVKVDKEKSPENKTITRQRAYESKPAIQPKSVDNFSEKQESMKREVSSLVFRVNSLPSKVNQIDNSIRGVSTRITTVRAKGYFVPKHLENLSNELNDKWNKAAPEISSYSTQQSNYLLQKQNNLESNIIRSNSINDLSQFETSIDTLSRDLILIENTINSNLQDYQNQYNQLNKELLRAEDTTKNLSNTSIKWKNNEHPVFSTKIQDLTNEKQGILTLSNLRILFEEEKEEVLKKTLFFATEKRTIREVIIDQPIGSIDTIEKGRVGFLKGAGIFIKFKPQTGLNELKIDTRSDDDDDIIHFYNLIISGEATQETEPGKETSDHIAPTTCPICSAPYSEEILKGQTSLKCKYCGSVIKL